MADHKSNYTSKQPDHAKDRVSWTPSIVMGRPVNAGGSRRASARSMLNIVPTHAELEAMKLIQKNRPPALRKFDQISMRNADLATQAIFMAERLAGKSVVFMGDNDSASLALGMLGLLGYPQPSTMTVVDFDERLLHALQTFAVEHGFAKRLNVCLYNAFDPVPMALQSKYDWFYTNPPYGASNSGASVQLFVNRGCEMTKPGGYGCVIIPDDDARPWTLNAMWSTQHFLVQRGWSIKDKIDHMHQYHLDDDKELFSSTMIVRDSAALSLGASVQVYDSRRVAFNEIPQFYGKSCQPPYPRYIRSDGSEEGWTEREAA